MPSRKIQKFLGIAPRISPELLPDAAAQTCVNAKLYSGDLIPYHASAEAGETNASAAEKTIYPLYDGSTKKWLSWGTDVDVAVASSQNDDSQRIYYTGDGAPKVTTYELAVTGAAPWPASGGYYELGLPLPTAVPTATPASISAVAISNVSRDANNIATYTTSSAHGYKTGNYVTVSGFTIISDTYTSDATDDEITVALSDPDYAVGGTVSLAFTSGTLTSSIGSTSLKIKSTTASDFTGTFPNVAATSGNVEIDVTNFNIQGAYVTVVDSTTFTAFSPGAEVGEVAGTFSSIYGSDTEAELAGNEVGRTYIYTWMTPWNEESVPSEPTSTVYVREGQSVTVGNLPNSKPTGDNFIRGIRVYRSVTDVTGSSYFLLRTIWFPNNFESASRTSNVVTATTEFPHMLTAGDLIKVSGTEFGGVADSSFDVTDVEVASVVDDYTFTYAATGSDKATTATTDGTLYWDIAEPDSGTSRYFESTTFVDDYDVGGLSVVLDSLYSDKPSSEMVGLKAAHNNILIGFFDNELCFSDPSKPWAWPQRYRLTFPDNIVAVEPVAGQILVLTEKYPYIVTGSNPANMVTSRADSILPCLAKRSVVNMGYAVVFATHGGLGIYSPSSGPEVITKFVHHFDTWEDYLDPADIVGVYYDNKYFGSHSSGSFLFERDDQVGGFMVTTPVKFSAAYYDSIEGKLYYTTGNADGKVYEWDSEGEPFMTLEWKSKVYVNPKYTSVGAARVVADYTDTVAASQAILDYNTAVPASNSAIWGYIAQLGTINGPTDYTDPTTSAWTANMGGFNSLPINGDGKSLNLLSTDGLGLVTFTLWANKEQQFSETISDSDIFRLPSNYRSDTFEVSVAGALRIRAIHMGETPTGLGTV